MCYLSYVIHVEYHLAPPTLSLSLSLPCRPHSYYTLVCPILAYIIMPTTPI